MELATWISFMLLWTATRGQDEFPVNPDVQNYQYKYFVRDENTGDVKSHEEKKVGDTVSGQYTVGEPTGDLRVVSYTADEGGFRADVKYEDGGSPLSDIRDKERQVNPVSGYQFQWLPGDLDDAPAAEKTASDESHEDSKTTEEGSVEGAVSTEGSSESTPTQTEENYSSSTMNEDTTPEAKKDDSSSEESDEKMQGDATLEMMKEPEASGESESKDDSKDSEAKEDSGSESKESSEASESEVAESSQTQDVAQTEPSQSYLPPPVPMMPNLPIYNLPMAQPAVRDNERPTIIYASQNFYNPWQWFGTTRVQREEPQAPEPNEHYMTGLGYIIVPQRTQQ